ncbi:MAG: hypothetical protein KC561_14665 [Myxococcales bacterium]|nr:hypothetical protein [Myxococcales bacterium]
MKLSKNDVPPHLRNLKRRISAECRVAWAFNPALRPPVLVYQMGKVGSSTVLATLQGRLPRRRALQVHFLSGELPQIAAFMREHGNEVLPDHIFLGEAIRRREIVDCPVVSLVRDPISHVVSDLFQNPEFANARVRRATGEFDVEAVHSYLNGELRKKSTFEYINTWFDRELRQVFGIDVFSSAFDTENGFTVYTAGRCRALVVRTEDLSSAGPQALKGFLGLGKPPTIRQANERAKGTGASEYKQVRKMLKLEREVIERIYQSRFSRHFWSPDQLERMVTRWEKG